MNFIIDEEELYYGIMLENDDTGKTIEQKALAEGFRKQNIRHITIIGGSTKKILREFVDKLSAEEKRETLTKIKNILESLEWKYKTTDIYHIQKEGYFHGSNILENRESYINLLEMPDIEIFYQKLNALLNTKLPLQLPHITLFTKGERPNPPYYGIPVPSLGEFKKLNPQKIFIAKSQAQINQRN